METVPHARPDLSPPLSRLCALSASVARLDDSPQKALFSMLLVTLSHKGYALRGWMGTVAIL